MNWEAIGAVGQMLGSIAVFVTLGYLSLQTRQNTKHTRALIQQGRAVQSMDLPLRWAQDASLADLYGRGNNGDPTLTPVELSRYTALIASTFWYFEDQFHQHQDGLISDDRFAGTIATIANNFQRPGFRIVWKLSNYLFGSQFRSFMDRAMSETRAAIPPDPFGKWHTSVAAELSEQSA